MRQENWYFTELSNEEIWQRYCGFLDLTIDEFMETQEHLLMEQLEIVLDSSLGKKLMGDKKPKSLEEFRHVVPLSTYNDYTPYLNKHNDGLLAVEPAYWIHTSWTKGAYKLVPWTPHFDEVCCGDIITAFILASCSKKGEVNLRPNDKVLLTLPPRPFASASLASSMVQRTSLRPILPMNEAEDVTLDKKIEKEFHQALVKDINYVICMSSILSHTTKEYTRLSSMIKPSWRMLFNLHRKVLIRLLGAYITGKGQNGLSPKDLWSPKAIISWGTDTSMYQEQLSEQWGKPLYQFYACSEAGFLATQSWNHSGLIFFPDSAFLEFLPQDSAGSEETLLLNELEMGKQYELVITSFYGMPFIRYRVGDLIKVVSLADEDTGIRLPHISIGGRIDQIVDLFSIARLDEATISQAIDDLDAECKGWVARKEYDDGKPILHLYIELKGNTDDLSHKIHRRLRAIDRHYREAVHTMKVNPIKVTCLAKGSFKNNNWNHRLNVSDPVIQQLTKEIK
jgi:hypothetical protein